MKFWDKMTDEEKRIALDDWLKAFNVRLSPVDLEIINYEIDFLIDEAKFNDNDIPF